jgi:hypothetical protein
VLNEELTRAGDDDFARAWPSRNAACEGSSSSPVSRFVRPGDDGSGYGIAMSNPTLTESDRSLS